MENGFVAFLLQLVDAIVLKLVALGMAVGLAVGFVSGIIRQRHGSIGAWVQGLAASMLVGVIVSLGMDSVDLPPAIELLIVCAAVYVADDVLAGLTAIGAAVRADPFGAIKRVFDALRGGSSGGGQQGGNHGGQR